uniref:Uncharacterized protein n=1 Tax=Cucumis melo TaxID=3656 RepID=A0A9I9DZ74_CUCME
MGSGVMRDPDAISDSSRTTFGVRGDPDVFVLRWEFLYKKYVSVLCLTKEKEEEKSLVDKRKRGENISRRRHCPRRREPTVVPLQPFATAHLYLR